jgi:hypothetical protein
MELIKSRSSSPKRRNNTRNEITKCTWAFAQPMICFNRCGLCWIYDESKYIFFFCVLVDNWISPWYSRREKLFIINYEDQFFVSLMKLLAKIFFLWMRQLVRARPACGPFKDQVNYDLYAHFVSLSSRSRETTWARMTTKDGDIIISQDIARKKTPPPYSEQGLH